MANHVRVFQGFHDTWTLQHVIKKHVEIGMQVVPSTGLLAIASHVRRFWQDGLMGFVSNQIVETFDMDPWELRDTWDVGRLVCRGPYDDDEESLNIIEEHGGDMGIEDAWLALEDTCVKLLKRNGVTHEQKLIFDRGAAIGCVACHGRRGIVVLLEDTYSVTNRLVLYAHPDIIAMDSMSLLRLAWMTVVVAGCMKV